MFHWASTKPPTSKAGFLAAIAKGEATSPWLPPEKAIELLGTMQGGCNIHPLIEALDNEKLAPIAAKALSHTLLMFDNFYDVEEKAKAGNAHAKQIMQSWADAEWYLSRPELAEKITVTVFKVTGETNTDDLSPAPDAWSRPDIPLHALAMLKTNVKASCRISRQRRPDQTDRAAEQERLPFGLRRRRGRHRFL